MQTEGVLFLSVSDMFFRQPGSQILLLSFGRYHNTTVEGEKVGATSFPSIVDRGSVCPTLHHLVLIALGSVFFPCPFRPDGGRSKRANAHILLLMASMARHFEAESASHICQRRFCLRLSPFSLSSSMVLPRLALSARGCGGQPHAIFFLRKRCEGGCTLDGWEVQPQLVGCFEKVLRQGRLDDVLLVGVNERDLSCMQV
mmetsp:Transcript_19525/g.50010  ORF Transcript_19525/g.50010 Transcript_19525/m.50010 type:complete len:200 (-) Transcript_19525:1201-1800(-)